MEKVDYNQFLYKPKQKGSQKSPEKSFELSKTSSTKPKNSHNLWFNIFVLILVAIIIILSINFVTDNYILDYIQNKFTPETKEYYLVCQSKLDDQLAYRSASTIKSGGGSGYVYKDENYLVVYSVFNKKSNANDVAKKNNNTIVKTFSYTSTDDEIINYCFETIDLLIEQTNDYENNAINESNLLNSISSQLKIATDIRLKYDDKKKKNNLFLLEFIETSLQNIAIINCAKIDILSNLRNVASSLVVNVQNYA
ncbi:MAG: hypothetical protein WCR54_04050 [Clostridia bacterium]